MGKIFYSLRITNILNISKRLISNTLGCESNMNEIFWGLEKEQNEEDNFFDYILFFAEKIESKRDELKKLGVDFKNISIWLIYEYEYQCNLEFQSNVCKKIGELGITLCISCYSKQECPRVQ